MSASDDYRQRRYSRSLVAALISEALGDTERAVTEFEDAIQDAESVFARPEAAITRIEYASVLINRGAPGDRGKVTDLHDEVIAVSQELGMKSFLARVLADREILMA